MVISIHSIRSFAITVSFSLQDTTFTLKISNVIKVYSCHKYFKFRTKESKSEFCEFPFAGDARSKMKVMDGLPSPIAAVASLLTTSPLTSCTPTSLGYLTLPQHPQQLISGLAVGGKEAADDPMEGATSSEGLDAIFPVPTPKQLIRPLQAVASIRGGDVPLQLEGAIPHMKCASSAGPGSAVSEAVRGAGPPESDYLAACELMQSEKEATDGRYNQAMSASQVASVQTPPKNGSGAAPTLVQEGEGWPPTHIRDFAEAGVATESGSL